MSGRLKRGYDSLTEGSARQLRNPTAKLVVALTLISLTVVGVVVPLKVTGVIGDNKDKGIGYVQFRITTTNASLASPNITVLTSRLVAVELVEDASTEINQGWHALIWMHPGCINKTLSTCNATALSPLNLLSTATALKTAMNVTDQNRTINSNHDYRYLRFYTCNLADAGDAATTTWSYKSGNMNVTKSFRDPRCNFTSVAIDPPISVQDNQGIVITANFNVSAVAVEYDSDPVSTAQQNLTKSGPHTLKYYSFVYPVWRVSFTRCNTTFEPQNALACAT